MHWDAEYKKHERVWGEGPSELAVAAAEYLSKTCSRDGDIRILDIGCGYGRDAFYYAKNLKCAVTGIDVSMKAIEIASGAAAKQAANIQFQLMSFSDLKDGRFDVVSASNLYQLLKQDERKELRDAVMRTLAPAGLLFLSALSINDPEHSGKGTPVPGEPNSFQDKRYLHLCSREELVRDFDFLSIKELYERAYDEPRSTGETHHHISWILIAQK
jgi:cyclopropane fatty-acyl-phospholipid synthase-like methyltransferase